MGHCETIVIFDRHVNARQRKANVAAECFLRHRIVASNCARFAHPPTFNHGAARRSMPIFGCTFGSGHAPSLSQAQVRKIYCFEQGMQHQGIEQGVNARHDVKGSLFQDVNELSEITWIRDQGHV